MATDPPFITTNLTGQTFATNEPPFISAETCGNCRYSDPRIGDDGDPYLRCRRYPPVVTMLYAPEPLSVFSQTDADEWCGEWKATDG